MHDRNPTTQPVKVRPKKPFPTFPLSAHANGQWYMTKRIGGRKQFFYFGEWADDPNGDRAHAAYLAVAVDIHAGRQPVVVAAPELIQISEVVALYIEQQEARVKAGEIGHREFDDIRRATLYYLLDAVGENTSADQLAKFPIAKFPGVARRRPLDEFRDALDARVGATRFNKSMGKVRRMFRWAYKNGLVLTALHEDDALKNKQQKIVKRERRLREAEDGKPIFTAAECRIILAAAAREQSSLLPFILLALNAGMGQSHISDLPDDALAINLTASFIDWVRPKTEELFQCPLWPITVQAMTGARRRRCRKPKADAADLFFATKYGNRWVQEFVQKDEEGSIGGVNPDDAIGKEFDKLLRRWGLKRRGRNFYALRRTFGTTANDLQDKDAIRRIMGHDLQGMDPHYVRQIPRWRLDIVVNYVGHKLLGCSSFQHGLVVAQGKGFGILAAVASAPAAPSAPLTPAVPEVA